MCLVLLAAGTWHIYGRGVDSPFVFDDDVSVVQNLTIRSLWPLSESLRAPKDYPTAGRPLVNLSLAVNYSFGELNPRGYHLYNLGNALAKLGRHSEAIECYETVLRLQPGHREAHNNLGKLLSELGQGNQAIPMLQRAVELAPQNPRAHLNLGVALLRAGQVDQAISEHHKALQLRPDYPEAHHHLGAIYLSRAQPAQAIVHLEQAVRSKPDYLKAWIKLADACASTGRLEQAQSCLRRALELAAASGQNDMVAELKSRLDLVQSQRMDPAR
ncbi:MAG TPA: tetratricopeptide repeat protein [Tepidisphaeraceae bacterium]|nr:tetratricopeptide repeat protein [Tepidisphaeraceae bacterium]